MARTPAPEHGGLDDFSALLAPPEPTGRDAGDPPRHGRARRRRRRIWPWVLGVLLLLLAAVVAAGLWVNANYPEQVRELFGWSNDYEGGGTGEVRVVIEPGQDGEDVAVALAEEGVTKTRSAFYELLLETRPEPTLEPGTYVLKERMSAKAALAALQDPASRVTSTVAIPEGSTLKQILRTAADSTGLPIEDLRAAAKDHTQFDGVPKSAPNLEGWVFPATYTVEPGTSATQLLQTMVDRMSQALDEAGVAQKDRERVLTLAGLVQKESNGRDDPKVARVFLNRLDQGIYLQSDATASYGAGEDTVIPSGNAFDDKNPYNTWQKPGLPAGPISSPGDSAIDAVVNPAEGTWLFFVTVNLKTGKTVFSDTDAEHTRAAEQFARWIKAHPEYKK